MDADDIAVLIGEALPVQEKLGRTKRYSAIIEPDQSRPASVRRTEYVEGGSRRENGTVERRGIPCRVRQNRIQRQ